MKKGYVAIFLISLFLISVLWFVFDRMNEDDPGYYEYIIYIKPEGPEEFEIFAPFGYSSSCNSSEMKEMLFSNMKVIRGDADFSHDNSVHGSGLRIRGSGNVTIISRRQGGEYIPFVLGLDADSSNMEPGDRIHWVYLNSSGIKKVEFRIDMISSACGKGRGYSEKTWPEYQTLYRGWNNVTSYRDIW